MLDECRVHDSGLLADVERIGRERDGRVGNQFGSCADDVGQLRKRCERAGRRRRVVAGVDYRRLREWSRTGADVQERRDLARSGLDPGSPFGEKRCHVGDVERQRRPRHRGRGGGLELESGNDSDVGARAADRPEQVGMLIVRHPHDAPVGGDDLGRAYAVDRQPLCSSEQSDSAGGRQATNTDIA
ncbi:Uncharacterised protein [Mycobacteroides abscessus subsp. abscessus]|nr:Uncharacterised protein [Mycobacteroides abscessus subsp. abscessus]